MDDTLSAPDSEPTSETPSDPAQITEFRVDLSVPEALGQWREAERVAAVARRGRLAAEMASAAAEDAAAAAEATAKAAHTSLEAARAAELSATKTAQSARIVAEVARVDLTDANAEMAISDLAEAAGHAEYRSALGRADERVKRNGEA